MVKAESTGSWRLVLLLWGAGLGAAAQYGKVSVVFDLVGEAYPEAGASVAWIVSAVGAVGILCGVVAGLLVARFGPRQTLILSLWLGAAMSLCQASLPPLWLLLSFRVLEGASHLGIVVAAPTLIAQITGPRQRGAALTLWGTFFGIAFAVLAFGGRPLAFGFGLPALFVAHGLYLGIFALILARHLPKNTHPTPNASLPLSQILADHGRIYSSARMSAPAAGWLFYTFSFVSILTVLPPYLDPEQRAAIMTAMPLVSIAVSMTVGVALLGRFSAVWVIQLGFALSLAAALWLWIVPGGAWAALALAAAMGLIQGASFAAVPQLNGSEGDQALANGAMAQAGNIGNTLGTPAMALALAGMGYAALPVLAATAFAGGMVAHALLAAARR